MTCTFSIFTQESSHVVPGSLPSKGSFLGFFFFTQRSSPSELRSEDLRAQLSTWKSVKKWGLRALDAFRINNVSVRSRRMLSYQQHREALMTPSSSRRRGAREALVPATPWPARSESCRALRWAQRGQEGCEQKHWFIAHLWAHGSLCVYWFPDITAVAVYLLHYMVSLIMTCSPADTNQVESVRDSAQNRQPCWAAGWWLLGCKHSSTLKICIFYWV